MTPHEAVAKVSEQFPFDDYIQGDLSCWTTVAEVIQKYLKPGDRLYDLGSGPCDKTAVAQVLGMQCTAVDDLQDDWHLRGNNVEQIEDFARRMNIDFSRTYSKPTPNSFDMVMMNDVLEHIHDSPRHLMLDLVEGLKADGLVFITVPNLANIRKRIDLLRGRTNLPRYDLYYWYNGPWRGPQREYTRGDLTSMCSHLGLEIVELTTVHHMLENLPAAAHAPYKAVTALFPDWRDTWLLVAKKPTGWQPKREATREEFQAIYGQKGFASLYEEAVSEDASKQDGT